jgi:3-hydroxymyristoyl/3-hydroxydecanoyl-(acyl carrier protein) dehydratase
MIDLVLELDHGVCSTIKAATSDEVVRDGRGSRGDYPFALLLEAMAQAALPLAGAQGEDHPHAGDGAGGGGLLAAIDSARLLRPVRPGDRLLITATVTGALGGLIRVRSVAEIAGAPPGEARVAEGEFTIAVQAAS